MRGGQTDPGTAREYPLDVREVAVTSAEGQRLAAVGGVLFAPGVLLDGQPFSYGRLSERKLRRTLQRRAHAAAEQPTPRCLPRGPRRGAVPLIALLLVVLVGCGVGQGAVASGDTFTFVAPGGRTEIFYDPPEQRDAVRRLSGESLLEPGRIIGLDDYPGQVVVLNIWGSWCGPCREEMPGLQLIHEQLQPAGVTLLGIDVRDDRDAARDFLRDRGITYPSLFDQPGRSLAALRGFPRNTVPSTIVLDRRHRVAAVFLTALRVAELLPVVERVAAEPPASGRPADGTPS